MPRVTLLMNDLRSAATIVDALESDTETDWSVEVHRTLAAFNATIGKSRPDLLLFAAPLARYPLVKRLAEHVRAAFAGPAAALTAVAPADDEKAALERLGVLALPLDEIDPHTARSILQRDGSSTDPADEEHYLKRELYQRMREDSSLFEFLQAGTLDGIWYWNLEKPEDEWLSPKYKSTLGLADDEMPNSSAWWQAHIDPEDAAAWYESYLEHERGERPYAEGIVRYPHKDGSTVWVNCRGVILRDSNGKPVRMLGAHNDVTELQRAQQALLRQQTEKVRRAEREIQRAEKRLRLVLDACRVGTWTLDVASDRIDFDEGMARLLGSAAGRMESMRDFLSILHPADGPPLEEQLRRVREEGRELQASLRIKRSDGTHHVLLVGQRIPGEGAGPDRILGVYIDETERVRQQAVNEDLQQFAHTVSHDLRSPLISCKGFLSLLAADLRDGETEDALDSLREVEGSIEDMSQMIEDLLDYCRGGAHRVHTRIDLGQLVRGILRRLHGSIEASAARVEVDANLGEVLGDPVGIELMLQNLLENALKYGGGDAPPRVEVGRVTADDGPRFYVRDHGPGIAECYQERIFSLFEQLDRRVDGTGAGLAIATRVIETHGGHLWLDSSPGEGATFWFQLEFAGS